MGRRKIYDQNRSRASYFRTSDVVFLVITTCVVSINMALLLFFGVFQNDTVTSPNQSQALNDFINEYNSIKKNYYGEINEEELMKAALNGLINALPDKNSNALDSTTSNQYDTYLKGYFEGVGIEVINNQDGDIVIYNIIDNSPAAKANIKAGDLVRSINNKDLTGLKTTELVEIIKKHTGTFNFVIERDGEAREVNLKKGIIELKSVDSEIINTDGKNIGYITISLFASNSDIQFKRELDKLEQAGIDGLIIDLRGNTGGYLSSVTKMLSIFIDKKDIIYQVKDSTKTKKIYSNEPGTKIYDIAVLVDQGSASASEIMAATLNEQLGAPVIGTKTYGKGTVQELVNNSFGTQYKYTTKEWLTPKGNSIEGIGIKPTIEVALNTNYYTDPIRDNDNQLKTALDYFTK